MIVASKMHLNRPESLKAKRTAHTSERVEAGQQIESHRSPGHGSFGPRRVSSSSTIVAVLATPFNPTEPACCPILDLQPPEHPMNP